MREEDKMNKKKRVKAFKPQQTDIQKNNRAKNQDRKLKKKEKKK